jgi:hypothetical protein
MGLGSGIRDPGKTYSGSRIQGSKRHRIPDPDPQHCGGTHYPDTGNVTVQLRAGSGIRDILIQIQIRGGVPLVKTEPDPDPDPALFSSCFQDANKN